MARARTKVLDTTKITGPNIAVLSSPLRDWTKSRIGPIFSTTRPTSGNWPFPQLEKCRVEYPQHFSVLPDLSQSLGNLPAGARRFSHYGLLSSPDGNRSICGHKLLNFYYIDEHITFLMVVKSYAYTPLKADTGLCIL